MKEKAHVNYLNHEGSDAHHRHQTSHQRNFPIAPKLNRTSMIAHPWTLFNPFERWLRKKNKNRSTTRYQQNHYRHDVGADACEWQQDGLLRRTILFCLTVLQTLGATILMANSLPENGNAWLEAMIFVLFTVLFFWLSAGFWTSIAGFLVLMKGDDRYGISRAVNSTDQQLASINASSFKTAIVMPICNEDVVRVFAGLRATYESLSGIKQPYHFDFFVLSDSHDPNVCAEELNAWSTLRNTVKGSANIFYRHRKRRVKRKSGNIADFCRRWGKNYRYMIVLDADSIMSGKCLTALVNLMEINQGTGMIQTAPRMAGRSTLFARIQQFAARAYGPLYIAGLHFWQLGESSYWGHNAIIRVAPFIRNCALAQLPGRGPLSGEILSHDFVEAALIRRAGWAVWIAYDLPGSYEDVPPNLLDELGRDRRWCHGNMINFRLILARGIHPVYRVVFAYGLMAYLSSLLWLVFLILSTILLMTQESPLPMSASDNFPSSFAWTFSRAHYALQLFWITASLLVMPKLLAVLRIFLQGAQQFGGAVRLGISMILESLFSILAAPIKMLFHSRFVVSTMIGSSLQWKSPSRDNAETTWRDGMRNHGVHTFLGVVWGSCIYLLNPACLTWLLPVVGAMVLSIPLSVLSSRVSLGKRLREMRLFLTPEEAHPPQELYATALYQSAEKSVVFRAPAQLINHR